MRVAVIAGARPNFVKIAPLMRSLDGGNIESVLVHTGQHYDESMSGSFFRELGIRTPDFHLEIGSASHSVQTARLMERFEPVYRTIDPDWLVVVGDVNSTLACSLVAAKEGARDRRRIAHLEAGLRSNDWAMPEEVNRVLTDHLSDLLLIPSHDARENLKREGISGSHVQFVGNVMIDSLYFALDKLRTTPLRTAPERDAVLVTLHRPSNVDNSDALAVIVQGLGRIAKQHRVVWPMHPRTRLRLAEAGLEPAASGIEIVEPLGYLDMIAQMSAARCVVTDSGGLQEETTVLGVPCLTLRESTERPVTLEVGTNRLATWPMSVDSIENDVIERLSEPKYAVGARSPEGWDGRTSKRVVDALCNFIS